MENGQKELSLGIVIAVGAAIGLATGDMGTWIAPGVAIATAIGAPLLAARNREGGSR